MNSFEESSIKPHFSHIYLEKAASDFADTKEILNRFPSAQIIEINSYKDFFNRPHQRFQFQKQSMKLVLAVKKDQLLYTGSALSPNFGRARFFYNTMVLNCIYNCDYCYLQGMYPSANIVVFVNTDDFFSAVDDKLTSGDVYLCISYDTDLLAFEGILQLCRRWISFAADRPGLTIELRTKSSNYRAIADLRPLPKVILAWTVSPSIVASKWEKLAPGTEQRLRAIRNAIAGGWPVRLCIDPVLAVDDWRAVYDEFIKTIASELDLGRVFDVSVGTFRMNAGYLSNIQNQRTDSAILFGPMEQENGVSQYTSNLRSEITSLMREKLLPLVGPERLHL